MMDKWRLRTNTLVEFLLDTDVCKLGDGANWQTRRSDFYREYTEWCRTSNRRPVGKHKLYDEIDENPNIKKMGVFFRHARDGTMMVRGVKLRSDSWAVDPDDSDEL